MVMLVMVEVGRLVHVVVEEVMPALLHAAAVDVVMIVVVVMMLMVGLTMVVVIVVVAVAVIVAVVVIRDVVPGASDCVAGTAVHHGSRPRRRWRQAQVHVVIVVPVVECVRPLQVLEADRFSLSATVAAALRATVLAASGSSATAASPRIRRRPRVTHCTADRGHRFTLNEARGNNKKKIIHVRFMPTSSNPDSDR
jgi:archaellum biogenesis protein FlaJ (TadC family)